MPAKRLVGGEPVGLIGIILATIAIRVFFNQVDTPSARKKYDYAACVVAKSHFSARVQVKLFRAYCTPLYTASLWVKYKKESFT